MVRIDPAGAPQAVTQQRELVVEQRIERLARWSRQPVRDRARCPTCRRRPGRNWGHPQLVEGPAEERRGERRARPIEAGRWAAHRRSPPPRRAGTRARPSGQLANTGLPERRNASTASRTSAIRAQPQSTRRYGGRAPRLIVARRVPERATRRAPGGVLVETSGTRTVRRAEATRPVRSARRTPSSTRRTPAKRGDAARSRREHAAPRA